MVDKQTGLHYPNANDGKKCEHSTDCDCAGYCRLLYVRGIWEPRPHPSYRILFRHLGQMVLLMQSSLMIEDGKEVIRWVEKFRFTQPPYFPDIKPQKP